MVNFSRYTVDAEVRCIKSMFVVFLVECKTSGHPKNKGIKHYDQTGQTKPGKYLKKVANKIGA